MAPSCLTLPRIRIKYQQKTLHALIDSAATHNFIQKAHLCPMDLLTPASDGIQLATANQECTVVGTTNITWELQGTSHTTPFYVLPNLREDLILGRPWLSENHVCLDFEQNRLLLGRHRRQAIFWEQKPTTEDLNEPLDLTAALTTVPMEQRELLSQLLYRHRRVFQETTPPTQTNASTHQIRLTSNTPVNTKPYRYSLHKIQIIEEEIAAMKEKGFIEAADTAYNSPIVVVPKKDGTSRLCIDYRKLNAITIPETPPQIRLHDAIRDLGQARIFTSLDLRMGYWQVPLDPSCRHYTAFTSPRGEKLQFTVMPFGLRNAPSRFQTMMNTVLSGFLDDFCYAYLDDIIIFSSTWEEHLLHLAKVLERLETYQLVCNLEKCQLGKSQLEYLGHVVTAEGNQPKASSINTVLQAEAPKTRKQLKAFMGLVGWLREFIPRAAEVCAPLTNLLSTKNRWKWTTAAEEAFQKIKEATKNLQPLHRPDSTRPLILQTDASKIGLGAVLYQEADGNRQVVAYASAKLSPAEQRYHSNEQECLAIVWAIKRYRPYLEDRPFLLRTDSKALTWLQSMKDSRAKLMRWALLLQEYTFTLEHCPGTQNQLADALSRGPDENLVEEECHEMDRAIPLNITRQQVEVPAIQQIQTRTRQMETLTTAQQQDPSIQAKVDRWHHIQDTPVDARSTTDTNFCLHYRVQDGLLWRSLNVRTPAWASSRSSSSPGPHSIHTP
jgi:hypothetical protein